MVEVEAGIKVQEIEGYIVIQCLHGQFWDIIRTMSPVEALALNRTLPIVVVSERLRVVLPPMEVMQKAFAPPQPPTSIWEKLQRFFNWSHSRHMTIT